VVTDGKTIMNDPLTDDDPVRLTKGGKALHQIAPREPLTYFLEGPAGYDSLVDKASAIIFAKAPDGKKAIELRTNDYGKMVVVYSEGKGEMLPERIDLYRSVRRRDDGTEQPLPTSHEFIHLLFVGQLKGDLFSVTPAKGMKVQDDRDKS
jgi:hypothetical protein